MTDRIAKVAIFISGSGTGLQAFLDAVDSGKLKAQIGLVVSRKRKAFGLERAAKAGVDSFVFKLTKYESPEQAANDLLSKLTNSNIDYIALAGYLKLLPSEVVSHYRGRIVNIHPALLPKYGGQGMYGRHVHEAVLAAGEKESGCTVHLVDEIYDNGQILDQARVPVLTDDTPETLAARVLIEEHKFYPAVLNRLIRGDYK